MSLPININTLIRKETVESERIEFKESWNPEEVLHTICAFANDMNNWGGGYIIIGIKEQHGTPVLPPSGLKPQEIDSIQRKLLEIERKISPNYTPIVSPEIYMKKNILVIHVPGGDARPYKAPKEWNHEKVYWVRKGSSTVIANNQDETKLLELANKIPFDDRINHNATLENLSLPLIQGFLKEVKSDLYATSTRISFEDLCRKINIARGPREEIKPINVGILLFCESPEMFFEGCVTEIINYKDETGDDFDETKLKGPLHLQLKNVLNYLQTNIVKEKVVKIGGTPEAIRNYNYPYEALEEAVANAFYHRSYEDRRSIEINIRVDRIEIVSYPGPLPPLNKAELRKERVVARDYRNRRIGDFLKDLRLTEGRGTGFPKIRKSMEDNGSPKPLFVTDDDLSYFITILPINPNFRRTPLSSSQKKILEYSLKPKSKREILEYLGLSNKHENAIRHIKPLLDLGFLEYQYPNIPNTPKQKYSSTLKAKAYLKRDK